jgi:hypothetical protein
MGLREGRWYTALICHRIRQREKNRGYVTILQDNRGVNIRDSECLTLKYGSKSVFKFLFVCSHHLIAYLSTMGMPGRGIGEERRWSGGGGRGGEREEEGGGGGGEGREGELAWGWRCKESEGDGVGVRKSKSRIY